ncbi:NUDIX hydrolase [Natrialba hulunbeirensis JCM 10989]|uniref:Oxidized purine nucleoside triphosphate hydrolase n=1 Tax=Natrialba hulunbeirensis JCM 10989 TaxID=1227493 RepID=L9ZVB2_9EURY|nr:8-oxo-dGTP diphosphatase [Natrialba hulunbeirensis]ELY89098.1 NUDIX hydrolase [Natrialba hulunbeirensis JCM 10989]
MIEATLCFVLRESETDGTGEAGETDETSETSETDSDTDVLLIEKRRGLGEGWYNGPGGKLEPGETPRECAARETREEVGLEIAPDVLEYAGELTFLLDEEVHTVCHVFRTTEFAGEPRPSDEARPEWTPVDDVPYDQMWEDDRLWLPGVLAGDTVAGEFHFAGGPPLDEAAFVDHELEWGVSFESRDGDGTDTSGETEAAGE